MPLQKYYFFLTHNIKTPKITINIKQLYTRLGQSRASPLFLLGAIRGVSRWVWVVSVLWLATSAEEVVFKLSERCVSVRWRRTIVLVSDFE